MNSSDLFSAARDALLASVPIATRSHIAGRYARHAPLLLERLHQLYGARDDFASWTLLMMTEVGAVCAARPAPLVALDQHRLAHPQWFADQHMLGYSTYVDRFGGTLDGVRQRIDYLRELGVTYLHLLPFLKPREGDSDGGFAVADFEAIAPQYGDLGDLRNLTAALRTNGISLCADLVLNHVADDHVWARAAAGGDPHYQAFFHLFADRVAPDRFEQSVRQIFPQAAPGNFTWSAPMQRWIWTTFYPYQWDLNYANPAVFCSMAMTLLRLANHGIEIFRLDSTAFLWKREGTDCMNQPETHAILQALRALVDIAAPGVLLKAEAIVPTAELPRYFGTGAAFGQECHVAYHSSLMAAAWAGLAEQSAAMLRAVVVATPALPSQCAWLTYVRCHDDIGWQVLLPEAASQSVDGEQRLMQIAAFFDGTKNNDFPSGASFQSDDRHRLHGTNGMAAALAGYARAHTDAERQCAEDRLLLLYGVAFGFGGIPVIYMGDEIALGNDDSAAARIASMRDGRWLQRPAMDLGLLQQRNDPATTSGRLFARMRRLIKLRQESIEFGASHARTLCQVKADAVLGLARGERHRLLYNFSATPQQVALVELGHPGASWHDLIAEQPVSGLSVALPAWGMLWLVREAGD